MSFKIGKLFARADELRAFGDYENAFTCLEEANQLRRKKLPFDIEQDREVFNRIKNAFKRDFLHPIDIQWSSTGVVPVFVLGMPRSGTTLVEQILASHSEVYAAGELTILNEAVNSVEKDFGVPELTVLRDFYLGSLEQLARGKRYVIDKLPLNFKWIGFIALALPEAKIINLNRDPRAVGFSNYCTNFTLDGNNFAYGLEDIAQYYNLYTELMDFWNERFPHRIHQVNYELLTESQDVETRRLLKYVGLNFESRCLEFYKNGLEVKTASALQVKSPMFKGSSDTWRNYEKQLEPMLKILR